MSYLCLFMCGGPRTAVVRRLEKGCYSQQGVLIRLRHDYKTAVVSTHKVLTIPRQDLFDT